MRGIARINSSFSRDVNKFQNPKLKSYENYYPHQDKAILTYEQVYLNGNNAAEGEDNFKYAYSYSMN